MTNGTANTHLKHQVGQVSTLRPYQQAIIDQIRNLPDGFKIILRWDRKPTPIDCTGLKHEE